MREEKQKSMQTSSGALLKEAQVKPSVACLAATADHTCTEKQQPSERSHMHEMGSLAGAT